MSSLISQTLHIKPEHSDRLLRLCGVQNRHLRQIEQRLGVEINQRGFSFQLIGAALGVKAAGKLLENLYEEAARSELTPNKIHLQLQQAHVTQLATDVAPPQETLQTRHRTLNIQGANQRDYVQGIRSRDLSFGVGPAGTGKTYLAVACAVEALEQQRVRRLVLTRPAVEAGERLGFLPGDLSQKIDPYVRPLYDALYELMGFEQVSKLIERNVIEVAPLAYMRGRTLNDAFVILDEGQNTTQEQMKMFLTRLGFGSVAVVTGDITQIDLPREQRSGLRQAIEILRGVEGVHFTLFDTCDVLRHALVQRIVSAYAEYEQINPNRR